MGSLSGLRDARPVPHTPLHGPDSTVARALLDGRGVCIASGRLQCATIDPPVRRAWEGTKAHERAPDPRVGEDSVETGFLPTFSVRSRAGVRQADAEP
jgi:hypothetical protein